jgi:STE24 endopeptidase
MWIYFAVIASVVELLYELYLHYREIKHLERATGPDPIVRYDITRQNFARIKPCEIAGTRFNFVSGPSVCLKDIAAIFLLSSFWKWTAFVGRPAYRAVLLPVFTIALEAIGEFPVCYYRAFVFDPKWSLGQTTMGEWLAAQARLRLRSCWHSALLGFGLTIACGILGEYFLLVACLGSLPVVLFPNLLFPMGVVPCARYLDVKLTPLHRSKLRTAVIELAARCQLPLKDIYKTGDFKWITNSDIFISGISSYSIGIADSLIQNSSIDDVLAMVGREIGRTRYHHFWKEVILGYVYIGSIIVSFDRIMQSPAIFESFGFVGERPAAIGMFIAVHLVFPIMRMIQVPVNLIHHYFDFQADAFAASIGLKIEELLMKGRRKSDEPAIVPEPVYVAMTESHPTLSQRIKNIREVLVKLQ